MQQLQKNSFLQMSRYLKRKLKTAFSVIYLNTLLLVHKPPYFSLLLWHGQFVLGLAFYLSSIWRLKCFTVLFLIKSKSLCKLTKLYQNLGGLCTTFSNVFKYILLNGVQFSRIFHWLDSISHLILACLLTK